VLLQLAVAFAVTQKIPVIALHVNHGLSPDADHWQAQCQADCDKLGISLTCKAVELGGISSANLEQRARQLRYEWFASLLEQADVLLTGHHLDDQSETLLLRLLRASGSRGLAAIPASRRLGVGRLIRPFLWHSKVELQTFAEAAGLNWLEDESNQCLDFDRNYIRHQVLPALCGRWPAASRQLARSAAHCRDDQALLEGLAELDLSRVTAVSDNPVFSARLSLNLPAFLGLSVLRQRHLMQTILRQLIGQSIPGSQMNEWLRQAASYKSGGRNRLNLGSINLVIYSDQIHFLNYLPDMRDKAYTWQPQQSLKISPLGLSLRLECRTESNPRAALQTISLQPDECLQVHWRKGGERVRLHGESHSRALKKRLQEKKIAPWLRDTLPLVSCRGEIIWSAALGDFSPSIVDAQGRQLRISFSEETSA